MITLTRTPGPSPVGTTNVLDPAQFESRVLLEIEHAALGVLDSAALPDLDSAAFPDLDSAALLELDVAATEVLALYLEVKYVPPKTAVYQVQLQEAKHIHTVA